MMDIRCTIILLFVISLHVILSPFTKIEESFNLQAIHDHITYGPFQLDNYDHLEFPGVVPRTFIGNLLLSTLVYVTSKLGLHRNLFDLQILSRLFLGIFNGLSIQFLYNCMSLALNININLWATLITISQFHVVYWCSRTLPNMFAFPLVNLALGFAFKSSHKPSKKIYYSSLSLFLLTFSAIVFRLELILLIAPIAFQLWFNNCISFKRGLMIGITSSIISLMFTVPVDTYFWKSNRILWPEFHSLLFNVYNNKAIEWGTSPFHSYFTLHLPKLLMCALPLSIISILPKSKYLPNETLNNKKTKYNPLSILFAPIVFISLFSYLKHKEWRFIVYIIPLWNGVASLGANRLCKLKSKKTILMKLISLIPIISLLLNLILTLTLTYISSNNYGGGELMIELHDVIKDIKTTNGKIGIDVNVGMTGASRFLELDKNNGWNYLKDMSENDSKQIELNYFLKLKDENDDENFIKKQVKSFNGVNKNAIKFDKEYVLKEL